MAFNVEQREQIQAALSDYVFGQTHEWDSPRPGELRKVLVGLKKVTSACAGAWRDVQYGRAEFVANIRTIIDTSLSENVNTDPSLASVWFDETIERIGRLERIIEQAITMLPADGGGRNDSKTWFPFLVTSLADVFDAAGGTSSVKRMHDSQNYEVGGFFGLVHEAQLALDEKFRYGGQSVGKAIERALIARDRGAAVERTTSRRRPVRSTRSK